MNFNASEPLLLLNYSFATESFQNFLYVFLTYSFLYFYLFVDDKRRRRYGIYKALSPVNLISKTNYIKRTFFSSLVL